MCAWIVWPSGAIDPVLYSRARGDDRLPGRTGRRARETRRREEFHGQGRIVAAMERLELRGAAREPSRLRRTGADPQAAAGDYRLRREKARALQPACARRRCAVQMLVNRSGMPESRAWFERAPSITW